VVLAGCPRRSPQHDGMRPVLRHHASDRGRPADQMILADDFGQRLGPAGRPKAWVRRWAIRRLRRDRSSPEIARIANSE